MPCAAAAADWYVNDLSLTGDSWCSAVGDNGNAGNAPGTPFLTISKALSLCAAGDTIRIDSGTYSESVTIPADSLTLLGVSRYATIISPGTCTGITAINRVNLRIRDLAVVNVSGIDSHAIVFNNVDLSEIRGCRTYNVRGNGINILNGSDNNTVYDNTIDSSLSIQICLSSLSRYNLIDSNLLTNGSSYGIFANATSDSNTYTNNRIDTSRSHGFFLSGADTSRVTGNSVFNCWNSAYGIYISSAYGNYVYNNTVDSSSSYQIFLTGTSYTNIVDSNLLKNGAGSSLISDADLNTYTNNRIENSKSYGIYLTSSDTNTVTGNSVFNCWNNAYGMYIANSTANYLYNNTVDSSSSYQIYLSGTSTNNTVDSNLLKNGASIGLILAVDSNMITNNRIENSKSHGIYLIDADTNRVTGNSVFNCWNASNGMYFNNSNGNYVHNNTFESSAAALIYLPSSTNNTIDSNLMKNGRAQGIYANGDSNTFTNNRIETCASHGIFLSAADTSRVTGNSVYNCWNTSAFGICINRAIGNYVYNNTVDSSASYLIYLTDTTHNNIIDSNLMKNGASASLAADADSNTFTNNRIENSKSHGIYLIGSDTNRIIGNSVYNCWNSAYGLYVNNANANYLHNNTIDSTSAMLIRVAGTSNSNTVDSNLVKNGISFGIYVTTDSNTYTNNRVENNRLHAIFLDGADTNVVSGNTVYNCWNSAIGIYLSSATNNTLCRNTVDSASSYGVSLVNSINNSFEQNTVSQSGNWAIYASGTSSSDLFNKCNIIGSSAQPDSLFKNASANNFICTRVWWGTTDTTRLGRGILNSGGGSAIWWPFRLGLVDTADGADTVAPRAPDTVAVSCPDASCTISWSPSMVDEEIGTPVTDSGGYRIYRCTQAIPSYWGDSIAQVGSGTYQYYNTGLTAGETYYYRVTAIDNHSPYANESFYSDSTAVAIVPVILTVNITSPADGYDTFASSINVSGTSTNMYMGDSVVIYVNQVWQCMVSVQFDSTWSGTAVISAIGDSITVKAMSLYGDTRYDTNTVNYYGTPTIAITYPANNHETNIANINVRGTASNVKIGDSVVIYRNNTAQCAVAVASGLAWSGTATVSAAGDSITAKVTDQWSRMAFDTRTVNYDETVSVSLSTPSAGAQYYDTSTRTFTWAGNADTYTFQISKSMAFAAMFDSLTTTGTSDTVSGFTHDTYYWRVIGYDHLNSVSTSVIRVIYVDTATTSGPYDHLKIVTADSGTQLLVTVSLVDTMGNIVVSSTGDTLSIGIPSISSASGNIVGGSTNTTVNGSVSFVYSNRTEAGILSLSMSVDVGSGPSSQNVAIVTDSTTLGASRGNVSFLIANSALTDTQQPRLTPYNNITAGTQAIIAQANARLSATQQRYSTIGSNALINDIAISDANGVLYSTFKNANDTARVVIYFDDAGQDGTIDGTGILENTLKIYYLDETNQEWIRLDQSAVNTSQNFVSCEVAHLTIYTIVGAAPGAAGLNNVLVYPNPFRPNDSDNENGKEYAAGDANSGIIIAGITNDCSIKIYDIKGRIVDEFESRNVNAVQWDGRNKSNDIAASGMYIVYVKDNTTGQNTTCKLAIIR